jgi:hypothetical protein
VNFQQIVAKLKLESGRQGAAPASPSTSTKDDSRLWGWVGDEWESLQTRGVMWRFLREARAITTVVGAQAYAQSTIGGEFQKPWPATEIDSYRARAVDGDTWYWMRSELSYDNFMREFVPGHAPGAPVAYAMAPDGSILLGPTPDRVMTVHLDVVRAPAVMTEAGDVPTGLPVQHRKLLAWGALKRLAIDDGAGELLGRANTEFSEAWERLWQDQGPTISFDRRSL